MISEIIVSFKRSVSNNSIKITGSEQAYDHMYSIFDTDTIELREETKVIFMDRNSTVLGFYPLNIGCLENCLMDFKLVLAIALKTRASCILIAHNHPSGSSKPSDSDKVLTNKINNMCKMMDIKLLDHLIVTVEKGIYYSFADNCGF